MGLCFTVKMSSIFTVKHGYTVCILFAVVFTYVSDKELYTVRNRNNIKTTRMASRIDGVLVRSTCTSQVGFTVKGILNPDATFKILSPNGLR